MQAPRLTTTPWFYNKHCTYSLSDIWAPHVIRILKFSLWIFQKFVWTFHFSPVFFKLKPPYFLASKNKKNNSALKTSIWRFSSPFDLDFEIFIWFLKENRKNFSGIFACVIYHAEDFLISRETGKIRFWHLVHVKLFFGRLKLENRFLGQLHKKTCLFNIYFWSYVHARHTT